MIKGILKKYDSFYNKYKVSHIIFGFIHLFQDFNYCFYLLEYWQVEAGRWVGYDKVTKVTGAGPTTIALAVTIQMRSDELYLMNAAKQNENKFTHGATKYGWKINQYVIQNRNTAMCNRKPKKKEELDIFFGKGKMFHSIPL